MVHDWLQHGKNERSDPWVVPLADDDPWPNHPDGSEIYRSDRATQQKVRTGEDGKLAVGKDGLLPLDARTHQDVTCVTANYWVGLSLFHTLFTLEHNADQRRAACRRSAWT